MDDALEAKILQKLGGMEEAIIGLKDEMTRQCNFKDEITKIAQEFLNYKKTREDLPVRVAHVESISKETRDNLTRHIQTTEADHKHMQMLWNGYTLVNILASVVSVVVIIMVFFHEKLGLTFKLS